MNMMKQRKKVLFGFKSVPYPLRANGLSVRYLPIIEHLSRKHDIDLLLINSDPEELHHLDGVRGYCGKVMTLPDPHRHGVNAFRKILTYGRFLFPSSPPLSEVSHRGSMVTRGIVESIGGDHYDAIVWVGGDLLSHFVDALPSISVGKIFVDFIDSPYLWAIRRKDALFPVRFLDRYDRWKTSRWEGSVIEKFDGAIYISRVDADAVPSRHGPRTKRAVIPNGVNLPAEGSTRTVTYPSPSIGFFGNMGYSPNVEAVEWLHKEVFVPLRKVRSDLTLVVIGRYPSEAIRTLGNEPGVIVTGAVDDIWEHISAIDLFVFPLLRGAGLKNKILEAMYAGRTILTTGIGNEGIDGVNGRDLVLCSTSEDFRGEALRLLSSPAERVRIGSSANAFVRQKFSWEGILRAYEDLILGTDEGDTIEGRDGKRHPPGVADTP
jgi:glycosyltransferase involved in cell wall biosynthesis